jgi:hypothetical protein
MNLRDYKEDTEKWMNGAPVKFGGAIFWIRRYSTPESNKALAAIRKRKTNPYETLTKEEIAEREQEVLAVWLVEFCVTKWRGVFDENDNELPFNKKNAAELFLNPSYYHSINQELILKSMEFDSFLFDNINKDIGEIKKRVAFDVNYPTEKEKIAYLKMCQKAGADPEVPMLNDLQTEILNAFYACDRERANDEYIKQEQAKRFTDTIALDEDISWRAIKELDSHIIQLRAEKHARKNDKG